MEYELINNFLFNDKTTTVVEKIIKELNSKGRFVVHFKDESTLSINIEKNPSESFRYISVCTTLVVEDEGRTFHRRFVGEYFQLININGAVDCFLELLNNDDRIKRPKIKSQSLIEIQIKDQRNLFNIDSHVEYVNLMFERFLTRIFNKEFYKEHKNLRTKAYDIDLNKSLVNLSSIYYNRLILLYVVSYAIPDTNIKDTEMDHIHFAIKLHSEYSSIIYEIEKEILAENFNVIV